MSPCILVDHRQVAIWTALRSAAGQVDSPSEEGRRDFRDRNTDPGNVRRGPKDGEAGGRSRQVSG